MRVLGVDPGITGAVALVRDGHLAVEDIPTMGDGKRRIINATGLADIVRRWSPTLAILERVHAMPKQGVSSSFRFGQSLGTIEGVLATLIISVRYVTPAGWKRHYRLPADKDAARLAAIQRYPHIADRLARKKDHNRAEALLIANWGTEAQ